jgi:DnaK suppressor protein
MPRTTTTPSATSGGAAGQGRASRATSSKTPVKQVGQDKPARPRAEKAAAAGDPPPAKAAPTQAPSAASKAPSAAKQPAKASSAAKQASKAPSATKQPPATKASVATKQAGATKAPAGTQAPEAKQVAKASSATKHAATKPPAQRARSFESSGSGAPQGATSYADDEAFLAQQRSALLEERETYMEQARQLRAEAESLVAEMEPGDVQFDEESGEGGTTTVDRERDLALSAQALAAVEEIDAALEKIENGRYGICERCGQLIPKARLEALPYARLCIACKSGGLSRR